MNSLFSLYSAVKLLLTWTLGSQQKLSHLQLYHPTEMIREWQPKPCSPLFFSGTCDNYCSFSSLFFLPHFLFLRPSEEKVQNLSEESFVVTSLVRLQLQKDLPTNEA